MTEEVYVSGVPKDQISNIWPMAEKYLRNVEEQVPLELSLEHVLQELLAGKMQLWLIARGSNVLAFCVTKVITYSYMKAVQLLWLAGKDVETWKAVGFETMAKWGRSIGASRLELIGRKGWKRILEKDGWTEPHVILHKEI